ncbi:MAG: hypothetical protein ACLQLC_06520 [Candidatus Sulfotelmatobacter sp.]
MDAFKQVVSEILWMDGYWVGTSVKVDLTKEEKVRIGRPSSPCWELDIVDWRSHSKSQRTSHLARPASTTGVTTN